MSVDETRQRLLDAAIEVFADHGFQNATVRQIATTAGVNPASINYHFRSKEGLYQDVFVETFERVVMRLSETDVEHAKTPEEALQAFVESMVHTTEKEDDFERHMRLVSWEIRAPTGVLWETSDRTFELHHDMARQVARRFLPPDASDLKVAVTCLWLIGQCLSFHRRPPPLEAMYQSFPKDRDGKQQVADQIMELALNGLRGQNVEAI